MTTKMSAPAKPKVTAKDRWLRRIEVACIRVHKKTQRLYFGGSGDGINVPTLCASCKEVVQFIRDGGK